MRIRKGDTVVVISGVERGKTGQVLRVFPKQKTVVVEKVRLIKRHTRAGRGGSQQGGIVEKEAPVPLSNLMVFCSKCGRGVRVSSDRLADGRRARACASCGEMFSA